MGYYQDKTMDSYIISERHISGRNAVYSDYPENMMPEIKGYLSQIGIKQLYRHQAEMFNKAMAGDNIVITTSTASGKTLSFLLPVLQQILSAPQSRAIFIYPTKALASDQFRAIRPILDYFGENAINAGVYDGDTPVNERSRIRNSANIILTNPEMLNSAFLPNHSRNGFSFIFSNLKYVVIDELHTYRGAFGSHLSNIFKRLRRICRYYNSAPQFLCSSATIANPVELAETICNSKFVLIDKDGSPSAERTYRIVQPPIVDPEANIRASVSTMATELIPELVVNNRSFITFCKSRRTVEIILKESRDKLKNDGISGVDSSTLISGYRAGYKPKERKEIEEKIVNGQLLGLISTNALELGIDIGKIDTAVLVGYPGTRASFWQQSGRAGRSGGRSTTYMILDNLPFDQFIAINPDWLFQSKSECAVVDPDNLYIQIAHVRAAAAELPISIDDIVYFPDLSEIIPVLIHSGELRAMNGRFVWSGSSFPAGDYSLRNMERVRYQLINSTDNSVLAEFDEIQAFREIHQGAIYLHDGQAYLVSSLDTENKRAIASHVEDNYYTVPFFGTHISIIKDHKNKAIGRTISKFGDVKVEMGVGAYKKLQFHNHQNLGFESIDPPLKKTFDSEGVWIQLPDDVDKLFRKLIPTSNSLNNRTFWKSYFDGLGFAIQNAAMMTTMTADEDIAAGIVTEAEGDRIISSICLYDMFVGGMGYSEKAFDLMKDIVQNAIKMIKGCRCKDGCSACVGDYHLDKSVILWGLESIFEQLKPPADIKISNEPKIDIAEKPFSFEDIETRWDEFVKFFKNKGEYGSNFISCIKSVKKSDTILILHSENSFYAGWIMDQDNKRRITNSISHYVNVPSGFDIRAESDKVPEGRKEEEIIRRYQDLRK